MSRFAEALRFVERIPDKRNILSIVLFGSVATGNDIRTSDIDIAVIYEKKDDKQVTSINELKSENIELTHLSLKELSKELEIQYALAGEGILLYGKPVNVTVKEDELIPKMVLIYEMKDLSQPTRKKLHRALYGGKTTSHYKNKTYESRIEGVVAQLNVRKLGKSVLYCDTRNAHSIIRVFKNLNVPWKEIAVWE
ncbi:MAG: nucleotidyltransferase domain-containing protein [Candidatus Hodarchaeales archaeon]|jgi:predicted nucleotidyltransferase